MHLRRLLVPSAWLVGITIAACGGASSTDLFASPETTPLGTDPNTANAETSPGTPGSPSGTSSSGSSGTSGSSGSSGSSSGSSGTSGGMTDAAADAPEADHTLRCGAGVSCAAGNEICCVSSGGQGKSKFQCRPASLISCVSGTTIACDDRTDCPTDQVCCGTLTDNSHYSEVVCRTSCESTPDTPVARFCDPNAAVDECAPLKKTCSASESLPGYFVCRD